jgi:rubrerythrin
VYVNTRPVGSAMTTYRPYLKKRMAEELAKLAPRSPEHESLSVDFARVRHYLDYDLREDTRAAAVFASYAGGDVFDAVQLPVELPEPLVAAGASPVLFPLLRVAARDWRAAVAVTDGQATRLFVLALGAIETRRELRAPALARPAAPGSDAGGHAADAARALEELARAAGAGWIVLGGESEATGELRRALAPGLAGRILEHADWDPREPEAAIAEDVARRVERRDVEARDEAARALVAAAPRGEAVLGADATVVALSGDRARSLLLVDDFPSPLPAWTCRSCHAFGAGSPPSSCPACDREAVVAVDLREEIAAQAQARGTPVRLVARGAVPAFDAAGGAGAFLR